MKATTPHSIGWFVNEHLATVNVVVFHNVKDTIFLVYLFSIAIL